MSNITPTFNAYLKPFNTHCSLHPRTRASTYDEFLKEAYRIETHITSLSKYLHSIRPAYLSTAPAPRPNTRQLKPTTTANSKLPPQTNHLTNPDRDAIDANAKLLLRDLSASLRQLADAESLRRTTLETVRKKKNGRMGGMLARWAAGGDDDGSGGGRGEGGTKTEEEGLEETTAGVRESVLWFLGRELEKVAELQRGMVERRVRREVERGRSVLYLVKGDQRTQAGQEGQDLIGGGGSIGEKKSMNADRSGREGGKRGLRVEEEEAERRKIEEQLTPEQLQVFASENRDMLKHYEDTLDQVRTAERSMIEISELQTTLVQNLDIQSANISQLVADSFSTQENVVGGNKELKKASERKRTARMVFWATCALSVVLVGWDLIF